MGWDCEAPSRVTDIDYTTILHWVRQAGRALPDAPESEEIPEIAELDGLQTYVANNFNQLWMAYKKRFGIEEMFRYFKSGGYDLEVTKVSKDRLLTLITIASTSATMHGQKIKRMGIAKYVGGTQESGRTQCRHSNFYLGLYGQTWVNYRKLYYESVQELMRITPHKRTNY